MHELVWRTKRVLGWALVLAVATPGCGYAIYSSDWTKLATVVQTTDEVDVVDVKSEPPGARIALDGAALGATPTQLRLTYQKQRLQEKRACWLAAPLALLDLGTGAATLWAANRWWNREPTLMLSGIICGVVGFLAAGGSGLACPWEERPESKQITLPRDYAVTLATRGSEERLTLRAPRPRADAEVVRFQDLEEADWPRLKGQATVAAYREYLASYPSGRWRQGRA